MVPPFIYELVDFVILEWYDKKWGDNLRKYSFLLIIFLLLSLPISALAHSGKTDGNGGHYDGFSYHYHHGYPAHSHLDMDGDGKKDCPYNFNDKTGQNSGSSGGSSGTSTSKNPASNSVSKSTVSKNEESPVSAILGMLLLSPAFYLFIGSVLEERTKKRARAKKLNAPKSPTKPAKAECLSAPAPKPFGHETIYVTSTGKRYHCRYGCCSATIPVHFYKRAAQLLPCSICCKNAQERKQPTPSQKIQINYQGTDLTVILPNGNSRTYYGIPSELYQRILATNPEEVFHAEIENKYPYY